MGIISRIKSFLLRYLSEGEVFKVDGICYKVNTDDETTVSVTEQDAVDFSSVDELKIPRAVSHNGKVYRVSKIESQAFTGYVNLKSAIIPDTVTTIGKSAFAGCLYLGRIDLPNSVTKIGRLAFAGCRSLTHVNIPDRVKWIHTRTFDNCCSLTSIVIPASITSISYYSFCGCCSLESIIVEEGNPKYDSRNNCNAIMETSTNTLVLGCNNTVIPDTTLVIGEKAFEGCDDIESVIIPRSVTKIVSCAFYKCMNLKEVIIPVSVTKIDCLSFADCSKLESIIVEEGNPKYDSRNNCNAIMETSTNTLVLGCKNTIIPDTTLVIGKNAFEGCYDLESIIIPRSVLKIGDRAFHNCSDLKKVIILNPKTEYLDDLYLRSFDHGSIVERNL